MEPDGLDQAVDVLEELPGEPGLADPGRPDDRHEPRPAVAARRMEQVLELAELIVPADERGLERLGAIPSADLGDDPERAPGRDRDCFALEDLVLGLLERDRLRGSALGRFSDEDRPGLGNRLQPAGGVHEVAGDHALVRRPDRDGRFAGQDAGPCLDPRAERTDRVDELERGSDAAFGIVLVGGRRAPDRHDRVANELLDGAAVAGDDLA